MKCVWILRGKNAGNFVTVADDFADEMVQDGIGELVDGSAVSYPENHPYVVSGMVSMPEKPKKRGRPKNYDNKMMTSE